MNEQHFTIKQVAELTELSTYTLRYYERFGLIDPVARATNGHRCYTEDDISRIRFIRRLRHIGMSLEDIQYFIELYHRQDSSGVQERYQILSTHREQILQQIDMLCDTLGFIDKKLSRYAEQMATEVECDLK